jgi:hypothetical protein
MLLRRLCPPIRVLRPRSSDVNERGFLMSSLKGLDWCDLGFE